MNALLQVDAYLSYVTFPINFCSGLHWIYEEKFPKTGLFWTGFKQNGSSLEYWDQNHRGQFLKKGCSNVWAPGEPDQSSDSLAVYRAVHYNINLPLIKDRFRSIEFHRPSYSPRPHAATVGHQTSK